MIRVCPQRDAACPHGMDCPYSDGYHCKDGWQDYRSTNPRGNSPHDNEPAPVSLPHAELRERLDPIPLPTPYDARLQFQRIRDALANGETDRAFSTADTAMSECPPPALASYAAQIATLERERDESDRRSGEMARKVDEIRAERDGLKAMLDSKPTGTKDQRERQMLKRMEAAESTSALLREALTRISQHSYLDENATDEEARDHWSGLCLIYRDIARAALKGGSDGAE